MVGCMSRRPTSRTKHSTWNHPVLFSIILGLAVPALFTWAYATTLDFNPVYTWLTTLNLMVIALMGKDKFAAQRGMRRTPEATLLLLATVGATPGLLLSRYLFHHKTSKPSFQYSLFAVLALQAAAFLVFWPQLAAFF